MMTYLCEGRSDAFKVVPAPTLQPATIRGSVPSPSIEDGMQAECARLYVTLTADLEQVNVNSIKVCESVLTIRSCVGWRKKQ